MSLFLFFQQWWLVCRECCSVYSHICVGIIVWTIQHDSSTVVQSPIYPILTDWTAVGYNRSIVKETKKSQKPTCASYINVNLTKASTWQPVTKQKLFQFMTDIIQIPKFCHSEWHNWQWLYLVGITSYWVISLHLKIVLFVIHSLMPPIFSKQVEIFTFSRILQVPSTRMTLDGGVTLDTPQKKCFICRLFYW